MPWWLCSRRSLHALCLPDMPLRCQPTRVTDRTKKSLKDSDLGPPV